MDKRWLIIFLMNVILLYLINIANDTLSHFSLFIMLSGLPVYFAAIFMPLGPGLLLCFILGLLMDSANPYFGTSSIILCITYTILATLRGNIDFEKSKSQLLTIQITNTLIIIASHLFFNPRLETLGSLMLTIFISQPILALISGWFIKLQLNSLHLFGLKYDSIEE